MGAIGKARVTCSVVHCIHDRQITSISTVRKIMRVKLRRMTSFHCLASRMSAISTERVSVNSLTLVQVFSRCSHTAVPSLYSAQQNKSVFLSYFPPKKHIYSRNCSRLKPRLTYKYSCSRGAAASVLPALTPPVVRTVLVSSFTALH